MLKLFSTFKAYYLFSCDVVNTAIINIKKIAYSLRLIMFIMGFRFSFFRNDIHVCIIA